MDQVSVATETLSVVLNNHSSKSSGVFRAVQWKAAPLCFLALLLTSIPTETSPLSHPFFLLKYHFSTCLNFTDLFKGPDQSEQVLFHNNPAEFTWMFILTATYSVSHTLLKRVSEQVVHPVLFFTGSLENRVV